MALVDPAHVAHHHAIVLSLNKRKHAILVSRVSLKLVVVALPVDLPGKSSAVMEDDGDGSIMTWLSRPRSLDFYLLAGRDRIGDILLDRGSRRGRTVGLGKSARGDGPPRWLEL